MASGLYCLACLQLCLLLDLPDPLGQLKIKQLSTLVDLGQSGCSRIECATLETERDLGGSRGQLCLLQIDECINPPRDQLPKLGRLLSLCLTNSGRGLQLE